MAELNQNDRAAVESEIFAGRKIEAIKLYREAVSGAGLAEAKEVVEAMEAVLRRASPEKFSASSGKSGCLGMILVVLGLASAGLMTLILVVGR